MPRSSPAPQIPGAGGRANRLINHRVCRGRAGDLLPNRMRGGLVLRDALLATLLLVGVVLAAFNASRAKFIVGA